MSGGNIDVLCNLWAASLAKHGDEPPFDSHNDLYDTIDVNSHGDIPWESFSVQYNGEVPEGDIPPWMTQEFDVWFRDPQAVVKNLLSNPDFDNEFDYTPFQEHDVEGAHQFQDFMSGNWAWKQGVKCHFDYCCH